ncbi:hypothetical protein [Methylobacterium sp. 1030]|uniref:hypothetical protein n=1 Tax=Methylobacterium sp. 1030 TaxID=3156404 RepID=UPI003396B26B
MATELETPQAIDAMYDGAVLQALSAAQNGGAARIDTVATEATPRAGWISHYAIDMADYAVTLVKTKTPAIIAAASAACDFVTVQVIPDATHQTSYTNAATIVWASGGKAPTTDPAKTIFAAQGATVGITNPDTFAQVVIAVSLASMQLATILGTLKAATDTAKSASDLSSAISTFEAELGSFVSGLNSSGLTVTVKAPDPIVIAGVNA